MQLPVNEKSPRPRSFDQGREPFFHETGARGATLASRSCGLSIPAALGGRGARITAGDAVGAYQPAVQRAFGPKLGRDAGKTWGARSHRYRARCAASDLSDLSPSQPLHI